MKELDLLVENYFTPALDATDILRLVEQVMLQEAFDIPIATPADVDNCNTAQDKEELKKFSSWNELNLYNHAKVKIGSIKTIIE